MASPTIDPILILGGSGSLGSGIARTLRQLQPGIPITITGRDRARAETVATAIGGADIAAVDLGRSDLGLPADARFSAVITCLRDLSLVTMRYAQDRGIPYFALSDAVFELGPTVAQFAHRPQAAPVVLLGHSIGSAPVMAALHYARGFERVDRIAIGLLFDPADTPGAATVVDMDRIAATAPAALMLKGGQWHWAGADDAARTFRGVDGVEHEAVATSLVDPISLAAATGASDIRVDIAEGPTASSRRGDGASHEVIVEIGGKRIDGAEGVSRYLLVDEGYALMSARAIAVLIERMLGLAGGPPCAAGLYLPETIVDPSVMIAKLADLGVSIRER